MDYIRVIIELDDHSPFCKEKSNRQTLKEKVLKEAKKRLHQYRNLGEDFKGISTLCQKNLGIHVEMDIESDADAEAVYADVLWIIHSFLSPNVNYYTLSELLAKGKSIETIFEGRPFRKESFGFIDTEELEQIRLRKEIHLSDLYQLASTVKGVKKVLNLSLVDCNNVEIPPHEECGKWIYQIPPRPRSKLVL